MRLRDLDVYRCPICSGRLVFMGEQRPLELEAGTNRCMTCMREYSVANYIPRFAPQSNYADSFGLQWNTFARTQLDSYTGSTISRDRFITSTGFGEDMVGQLLLEAGCGAGRFTEIALNTGARLFTFDYSSAIDANLKNNGLHSSCSYAQADILSPPFAPGTFDRVFCLGVLQHLPDPASGFLSLARLIKPGGYISIDVYERHWYERLLPRSVLRRITRRIPPQRILPLVQRTWPKLARIKSAIQRIPIVGDKLDGLIVPICDYTDLPLEEKVRVEWGMLDTFDVYATRYEINQTTADVRRWFESADLEPLFIGPGHNGIVARGRRAV